NVLASKTRVGLFLCPSDPVGGQIPGLSDIGTNYVACNGTGLLQDPSGSLIGYAKIPEGNGIFAQEPVRIADITDGAGHTASFPEAPRGNGQVPAAGTPPADPRLVVLEVAGGNDPTPADCDGMNGTWSGARGGQWINGHYGNTLYNHYYTPNQPGKW